MRRTMGNAHIIQTADGKFGYLKNLSKYYLICVSYVQAETEKKLQSIHMKPDDLRSSSDEAMAAEERHFQKIILTFKNACTDRLTSEEAAYVADFMKTNSLEDLVKAIIPREFDNVYTAFNNFSSLEVNNLIRSLRRIFGNSDKVNVISAYLSYCLDDRAIKENMIKMPVKVDKSKVKAID